MCDFEKVERRHSLHDLEIVLLRRVVDLPAHGVGQSLLQVSQIVPRRPSRIKPDNYSSRTEEKDCKYNSRWSEGSFTVPQRNLEFQKTPTIGCRENAP